MLVGKKECILQLALPIGKTLLAKRVVVFQPTSILMWVYCHTKIPNSIAFEFISLTCQSTLPMRIDKYILDRSVSQHNFLKI